MNTITVILEAHSDETLHLPLPPELRHGKIEVAATLKPATGTVPFPPRATPEMLQQRKEAFQKFRKLNPFRDIQDPAEWQKEIRKDRPLPGRD